MTRFGGGAGRGDEPPPGRLDGAGYRGREMEVDGGAVGARGGERGGDGGGGVDDEQVTGAQVGGQAAEAVVDERQAVALCDEQADLVALEPARLGRRARLVGGGQGEGERAAHACDSMQRPGGVATTRQLALDQRQQPGHALRGRRAVGDVLAGEGLLVHARVHVARVDGVDAPCRVLGGEDRGQLLERGLRGAVAAPALVGLDRSVGGDVDDPGVLGQARERELDQRQRGDHVDAVDGLEHVERVVGERRLRARAEQRGVVDEQVDALARGLDERAPVARIADVAGEGDDVGELRGGGLERPRVAGVDHEPPAALGEGSGEGEAEAAGGAGDDGGGHGYHRRRARAPPPSGIGPRTPGRRAPRAPRTAPPGCGRRGRAWRARARRGS